MTDMTPVQRKLWLAWLDSERKLSHLMGSKPVQPADTAFPGDGETHRQAMFDWREDFNQALGERDGLRSACVIAEVPNMVRS